MSLATVLELQARVRDLAGQIAARDEQIATLRELVQAKREEIARLTKIIRGQPLTIGLPTEVGDE